MTGWRWHLKGRTKEIGAKAEQQRPSCFVLAYMHSSRADASCHLVAYSTVDRL